MQKFPNNIKKNKPHKVKTYKGNKNNKLSFFKFGLKTTNISYLTWNNFESFRKVYVRAFRTKEIKNKKNFKLIQSSLKKNRRKKPNIKKKKKVNQLIFKGHFWSSLTKKPLQVRMGKGKGNPYKWVFPCSNNRILIEQLLTKKRRKIFRALKKAFKKMPLKTKFIFDKKKPIFPHRYKNKLFIKKFYHSYKEILFDFKNRLKINKKNEQ